MKKWIAFLVAAMLTVSLCACTAAEQTQTGAAGDEKNITVTVVHADGSSKDFTYTTEEEFLGPVLLAAGLIEGNQGPYGLEISKVDGQKAVYAEDNAYWALYEGEEYALQGIDTTPVVDGKTYKLVYTCA